MLSVIKQNFVLLIVVMLSVIMLNALLLIVVMLSVIMIKAALLIVVMLYIAMLNVVMIIVVMLSVIICSANCSYTERRGTYGTFRHFIWPTLFSNAFQQQQKLFFLKNAQNTVKRQQTFFFPVKF
jgi:hypothetical protein